jgi:hypothetical protein
VNALALLGLGHVGGDDGHLTPELAALDGDRLQLVPRARSQDQPGRQHQGNRTVNKIK